MNRAKILRRILPDFSKSPGPGLAVQPGHDLGHRARHTAGAGSSGRSIITTGRPKRPGRGDLGDRALAAGVLGDDDLGSVLLHQGGIACHVEGPARHDHIGLGNGRGPVGGVDQPEQVVVLRLGREGVEMLATDGQEHALRRACPAPQRRPAMSGTWVQRSPSPGIQGARSSAISGVPVGGAGGDGVGAHLRGEGVRGVDHMGDAFRPEDRRAAPPPRQSRRPACGSAGPSAPRCARRRNRPPPAPPSRWPAAMRFASVVPPRRSIRVMRDPLAGRLDRAG